MTQRIPFGDELQAAPAYRLPALKENLGPTWVQVVPN